MAGFEGKTIEVDLSSGKISKLALDKRILRPFIGGSGLGPSSYTTGLTRRSIRCPRKTPCSSSPGRCPATLFRGIAVREGAPRR